MQVQNQIKMFNTFFVTQVFSLSKRVSPVDISTFVNGIIILVVTKLWVNSRTFPSPFLTSQCYQALLILLLKCPLTCSFHQCLCHYLKTLPTSILGCCSNLSPVSFPSWAEVPDSTSESQVLILSLLCCNRHLLLLAWWTDYSLNRIFGTFTNWSPIYFTASSVTLCSCGA